MELTDQKQNLGCDSGLCDTNCSRTLIGEIASTDNYVFESKKRREFKPYR